MPTPTAWTTEAAAILEREQKMSSKTSGSGDPDDRAPATADHRRTCWCGHRWRDHGPAHGTTDVFGGKCLAWVDDPDASSLTLCTCRAWHTHERLGAGSAEYRRGWRDAIEAEAADLRVREAEGLARPDAAALAEALEASGLTVHELLNDKPVTWAEAGKRMHRFLWFRWPAAAEGDCHD